MFDQIKDLYNLRKQAQELQKQMATEQVTGNSQDKTFSITINGNHELMSVNISPDINLNHPEIEKNIKQAFADAQEKLKALLAQKFQGLI
ncbi:MAG TPA: YbaB/EbfC family nucleoid-associated protein [Patescibacteria group bacterium]|jgi:DNA-binding protein YbaB|nr:YbaB/EbfC family nucleoid-associated protein [Patescibacteria group bacterium]